MKEFMILILATGERNLSPEETEKCLSGYAQWAEKIGDKHVDARRLGLTEGKLIDKNKEMVLDGPFAESKELIAGFALIMASDLKEAIDLAHTCPLVEYFDLFVKEVA